VGEQLSAVAVVVAATSFPTEVAICGRPALEWVLSALASLPAIREIVVPPHVGIADPRPARLAAEVRWCRPRDTRIQAISSALRAAEPSATVLLHDADQPLVTPRWLADVLAGTAGHPAVASGVPVKAAFKRVTDGVIEQTVPRERLVRLVGPRAFRRDVLSEVLDRVIAEGWRCGDEVRATRLAGVPVAIHTAPDVNVCVTDALSAALVGRLACRG
jgi:2-C-methyl-D-erythritol 4-phosphate cytidylyltransferase